MPGLIQSLIKNIKALVFLMMLITAGQQTHAQTPVYSTINVENGLPSNETYAVFQDSKGYIWIATDRGVVRYNGYEYETFTTAEGLADNVVFDFTEDSYGNIWFDSFNGKICYYDGRTFQVVEYPNYKKGSQQVIGYNFNKDTVHVDLQTEEVLLIRNSSGTFSFSKTKHNTKRSNSSQTIPLKGYILDDWDQLFFGSTLHKKVNDSIYISTFDRDLRIYKRKKDSNNRLKIELLNSIQLPIYSTCIQIKNGLIYVVLLNQGIVTIDPFQDSLELKPWISIKKQIAYLLIDNNDVLWVATLTEGVLKFQNTLVKSNNSLKGEYIEQIFSQQKLHIMSDRRLYVAHPELDSIEMMLNLTSIGKDWLNHYNYRNDIYCYAAAGSYAKLRNSKIHEYSLITDRQTVDELHRISMDTITFCMYHAVISELKNEQQGILRKGTSGNVGRLAKVDSLDQRTILYCGLGGIGEFDIYTKQIKVYGDQHEALNARISDFSINKNGQIIIATRESGLFILDRDKEKLYSINKKEGLLSNLISNVNLESDSVFWISTNEGISRISIQTYEPFKFDISNITKSDGLSSNKANCVYHYHDTIYAGMVNGLNYFPKNTSFQQHTPTVHLVGVKINEKDTMLLPEYSIKFGRRIIELSYQGISTKEESNLEYKYRLHTSDTSWIYTENRSIQLLALPIGSYQFELYALNKDGIQSESPVRVNFEILPPLYLTWWFILLEISVGLGLVYLIVYIRIQRIRSDGAVKLELFKLENKALSSQLNPHFIFNALTAIQHYILKQDRYSAYTYLSRFANLMRSILKNSEDESVRLSEDIILLEHYLELEKIRFKQKFEFEIEVDESLDVEDTYVPSMLIQPYAENAIRHGFLHKDEIGYLSVRFTTDGTLLVCSIEDNGIGRKAAQNYTEERKHRSFAMGINERRLLLLNKLQQTDLSINIEDLYDDEENALGTRVTLYVPME